MRRKAPVQFLGEGALATAPPYPTESRTAACQLVVPYSPSLEGADEP